MSIPALSPDAAWGVALAVLSMLTYGTCMVLVSVGMRKMRSEPGSLLSAVAGVPAGLLIAGLQLASNKAIAMPSAWTIFAFAMAGVFSTYLGRWLVFKSIELIGPSSASALQSTSPLITAVFAWIFLGERIGWLGVLGITLAICGLVSMSTGMRRRDAAAPAPGAAAAAGPRKSLVLGTLLFGLASSAAYSGSHIFRASAVREWNEPLLGATIGAVAGLLVLLLSSRTKLAEYRREIQANPAGARLFLGIGVLQFLAQSLVIASMKYLPASVAALISMCTPLVVMPISFFILKNQEKLNPVMVFGICITLAGAALSILAAARL